MEYMLYITQLLNFQSSGSSNNINTRKSPRVMSVSEAVFIVIIRRYTHVELPYQVSAVYQLAKVRQSPIPLQTKFRLV
jgi:hypothetical protein